MCLVSKDGHFNNIVKVFKIVTFIWFPCVRDESCGGGHLDLCRVSLPLCVFCLLLQVQCCPSCIYVWCGVEVLESEPVGSRIKFHVIKEGGEKPVTGDASICFSLKWLDHWFGGVCSGHLLILNKPCPPLWQQRWPLCIADIDSIGMLAHEHMHDTYVAVKTGKGFFLSVPKRQPTTIKPKTDSC